MLKKRLKSYLRTRLWNEDVAEQLGRTLVNDLLQEHRDAVGEFVAERFVAQWERADEADPAARGTSANGSPEPAGVDEDVKQIANEVRTHIITELQNANRLDMLDQWLAALVARITPEPETPAAIVPEQTRLEAIFDQSWARLIGYIQPDAATFKERLAKARHNLKRIHQVRERSLDLICEDNLLQLRDASLRFIDRKALWTVIREILVNEEYYFEHPNDAPRIIDGGSNFGLSLYYFKHLYPNAKILGFEPAHDLWQIACDNVTRNRWQDVEVLPYALAGEDRTRTFYDAPADRLGGSLTQRKHHFDVELVEHEVECRRLSTYLTEPVDFLKLDIEGAEREVLPEIREHLPNIRHVFCEYHVDPDVRPELLGQTVQLLEQADFHVHVGKSDSFGQSTHERPMEAVGRPISLVIWAKNRRR